MKKTLRIISAFLCAVIVFSSFGVSANSMTDEELEFEKEMHSVEGYFGHYFDTSTFLYETVDGVDYIFIVENGESSILNIHIQHRGPEKIVLTLPTTLGGYPVTTIGSIENPIEVLWYIWYGEEFELISGCYFPEYDPGLDYVSKIIIPEGYEYIANWSLRCWSAVDFQFPKSLKMFYDMPFETDAFPTTIDPITQRELAIFPECEYEYKFIFQIYYMIESDDIIVLPSRNISFTKYMLSVDDAIGHHFYVPSNLSFESIRDALFYYDDFYHEDEWKASQGYEIDGGVNYSTLYFAADSDIPEQIEALDGDNPYPMICDLPVATHIAFDSENISVEVGEVVDLEAKTYPAEAVWTACDYVSSNPEVVKVDPYSGRITALAEGEATITATHVERGFVDTCTVKVEPKETNYKIGDIIEFGSYPQTQVTDDTLIDKLNSLDLDWHWYDYYRKEYLGTRVYESRLAELMQYADVAYNGGKYRAVRIKEYRTDKFYQRDNGFLLDNVYWYKYEPISWRVLDPQYGLVISEKVLDSQPMSEKYYYNNKTSWQHFVDSSCTTFPCEYNISTLRNWLNKTFYNIAFSLEQKNNIILNDLENDGTIYDKVFILSIDELCSDKYGFNDKLTIDLNRIGCGTDYALSQGLHQADNCSWFTKSTMPLSYPDIQVEFICEGRQGTSDDGLDALSAFGGIRPAIQVDLNAVEPEHICTPAEKWSADETAHWLECTDPECGEIINYAEHSGGNATVNAKAICEHCGTAYGEYVAASFSVEPVSDIAYCKREKREYKITVAEKADKVQFIRDSGSTTTFVRSQAAEIINNGDGTETWILAVSLNKGKYTLAT
ncbi:MAG: Ig-like domain-containing protein, partial [Clostridia bacterium]|nr:Ig-like domain-containing protein [Clostridia bacterium]